MGSMQKDIKVSVTKSPVKLSARLVGASVVVARKIYRLPISLVASIRRPGRNYQIYGVSVPLATVDSLIGLANMPSLLQRQLDLKSMVYYERKQRESQRWTSKKNTIDLKKLPKK